ncbi:unnamed protein product [Pleuronectes platessa]|uniref:Uncharacterized protein n=1 Tax=Pleuronectes platessa TaxID=8262 RepID=A0A9N7UHP9_PLEPL|nr:unnamed protein product [Pleuronectes platessa]
MSKTRGKAVVQHVHSPSKLVEDLRGEIKHLELKNLGLVQENATLKMVMSSREAGWKKENKNMEGSESERLRAELETEIKQVKKESKIPEKDFRYLNACLQNQQTENEKLRRELRQQGNLNETEGSLDENMTPDVHEGYEMINMVTRERNALKEENKELMAQLKTSGLKIIQNKNKWQARYEDLEFHLRRELAESRNSSMKIKQLERLVKHTEVTWAAKNKAVLSKASRMEEDIILQKDQVIASVTSRNMALEDGSRELMAKLLAMENEILQSKTEWQTKVNDLEDSLRHGQAEMEASFKIIKKLEKRVKDTKDIWTTKQEDSPNKKRKME